MSEIKDKAKQLKEVAKKYGYEIKHTHALEIISQLDHNVNRHVSLKNEKQNYFGLEFRKAPLGISVPFFEGYVIELVDRSESINFYITDQPELDLESLCEYSLNLESIRYLTEDEVKKPGLSFSINNEDDESQPVPFNSLFDWIIHRAKEEKYGNFFLIPTN